MVNTFDLLATEFVNTSNQDYKLRLASQAMAMPDIRQIVASHSTGWNGNSGKFARVIACMILQMC
jgi:hypothetical protein